MAFEAKRERQKDIDSRLMDRFLGMSYQQWKYLDLILIS